MNLLTSPAKFKNGNLILKPTTILLSSDWTDVLEPLNRNPVVLLDSVVRGGLVIEWWLTVAVDCTLRISGGFMLAPVFLTLVPLLSDTATGLLVPSFPIARSNLGSLTRLWTVGSDLAREWLTTMPRFSLLDPELNLVFPRNVFNWEV